MFVVYYPCIDSTNRAALELAAKDYSHGWVVLADEQSHGRGRLDRSWDSRAAEDILLSIICYPELAPEDAFRYTMAASIAVVQAVRRICDIECGIKWPNDILFGLKKLCGILTEAQFDDDPPFMVIGIGLNANSRMADHGELANTAVSLLDATGQEHDRNQLIIALLEEFNSLHDSCAEDAQHITRLWEKHAMLLGRTVSIHSGTETLSGTATGITADGRLVLRDAEGQQHLILCGDLHLRFE